MVRLTLFLSWDAIYMFHVSGSGREACVRSRTLCGNELDRWNEMDSCDMSGNHTRLFGSPLVERNEMA